MPDRTELRAARAGPILELFDRWIDSQRDVVDPRGRLDAAITYYDNQREAVRRFLRDGRLPLDNGVSERELRSFAVGRKNFLFVGHQEGGHNLAILQTLCSTCLLHGINPYEYIRDVAVRVRFHPYPRLDDLPPMNWKPPPGSEPST